MAKDGAPSTMTATHALRNSFLICLTPSFTPMAAGHQRKRAARALADFQRPGWVTGALDQKLPQMFGLCLRKSKPFTANENGPATIRQASAIFRPLGSSIRGVHTW
jgi:hypothetical protein